MKQQRCRNGGHQKGAVALWVVMTLPVLAGVAALAIDLSHAHVVRAEMQNDADAAALSGARVLVNPVTGQLEWGQASSRASQAIGLNRAEGRPLIDGQVQTGYWNLQAPSAGLQGLPMTPGLWDVPAVAVHLRKQDGQNDGPAKTFFAGLWGIVGVGLQVTAVAAPNSPGLMQPGGLFPLAMADCMYREYWDTSRFPGVPRLDPATGQPYVFRLGSGYHYGPCASAEWTALLEDRNDVTYIRGLIEAGNPVTVGIGQDIWIEPGTKTALFQRVKDCSAAGDRTCEFVVVPTVSQVQTHARAPVQGLACLNILNASPAEKYVLARMSNQCQTTLAGGAGPAYGVLMPPSLVH